MFVDRVVALQRVEEMGLRGTRFPVGRLWPGGCGKTALLRQACVVLKEQGYECILADPLEARVELAVYATPSIRGLLVEALRVLPGGAGRIAELAVKLAGMVLERLRRPRLALLLDDLFQAVVPTGKATSSC